MEQSSSRSKSYLSLDAWAVIIAFWRRCSFVPAFSRPSRGRPRKEGDQWPIPSPYLSHDAIFFLNRILALVPGVLLLAAVGYAGKFIEQFIARYGKAHHVVLPNIEYVLWAILSGYSFPTRSASRQSFGRRCYL